MQNSLASGCTTGAVIASKQGPQAMALGCAGFAAFSAAIETAMKHYDWD
jgi:import inner membrane translocase subunit TIM22